MEYRHQFDDPDGDFLILKNRHSQYSLWPEHGEIPTGWQIVSGPATQTACQTWLNDHWQTLLPTRFAALSCQ